ncbi:menaquinone-dependent protoporphyrinogen IX dehydrogenase [Methylomarinum vadi]|uniref:menaquinone-dependent protoporphyrinogen IX dehydrogenase n=1 Tax=Methylomarinum vadi TaxID=438855 RepID=UPI0004DF4D51|nr:menaquinone-dependent protoporphyrinogen IX dehydrogenase [Methylomarinum vadi]
MANILILYSTTDGHTREICRRLKQVIEGNGHRVSLHAIDSTPANLAQFDKIVLGASIRYGKHAKQVYRFIEKNRKLLDDKPNAFFSVNAVARKAAKNQPETNPYLRKFLKQIAWQPRNLAVFAGKIDYPRYRPLDRLVIRLIMWLTKGPTDPNAAVEFTDWKRVETFAKVISEM